MLAFWLGYGKEAYLMKEKQLANLVTAEKRQEVRVKGY